MKPTIVNITSTSVVLGDLTVPDNTYTEVFINVVGEKNVTVGQGTVKTISNLDMDHLYQFRLCAKFSDLTLCSGSTSARTLRMYPYFNSHISII